MDPEFIYHDTIRQTTQAQTRSRQRSRSLLQNIATEKSKEPSPEPIGLPAKPAVAKRRARSFGVESQPPQDKQPGYVLSPLTIYERTRIELEILEIDDENDDDKEEDVFDDIDLANLEVYTEFEDTARYYSKNCTSLLSQSQQVLALLDELTLGFENVKQETKKFEETCDSLISQHEHLSTMVGQVDENLEFFTRLEKATRMLQAPGSNLVTKPSFSQLLKQLDEGLEYVAKHDSFRDIDLYQMRYRQCMTRALTLAQTFFTTQIRNTTLHIQQQVNAKMLNSTTQQAMLYARFEKDAERLRPLTDEISSRCQDHQEYYGLFSECLKAFFTARERLLAPIIPKKFEDGMPDLIQFTNYCLSFYKQLCRDERGLFDKFFATGMAEADEWLMGICEPLYDSLRQRIIRENDIDNLCELTTIFLAYETEQAEIVDFATLFKPILQDVQQRLVFRVQYTIDNEISKYQPKPEDLNLGHRKDSITTVESDSDQLFQGWYPPMRRAIMLLSQIYQLVHSAVFDDLAHRILHECLGSLENAHKLAVDRLGQLEGQLFLIKHLLILSQQITGFDIDTIPAEMGLDFSGLQEAFAKVRREGVSLGSNLLNLAKESVPKVVSDMLDAKEELYAKLKNAIHEFTEVAVKSIVAPIIDKPEPEHALEATRQVRQLATEMLPKIRKTIGSYINDERTIDILIDSIQDLVVQTYERYQEQVVQTASSNQLEGVMEVDGLVSWLGDIVSKLG